MIQKISKLLFILCLFGFICARAQVLVKGKVIDSQGILFGVNIIEEGTENGVTSEIDGSYSIKVANNNAVLKFSYLGYTSKSVKIDGKKIINVTLVSDTQVLDVVNIGYVTQKKGNLTGAVTTIDSKVLGGRPVSNTMQALQGAAPGLQLGVGSSGGQAGAAMKINIRGSGSLDGNGGSPLIIVDDIPLEGSSSLNDINPEDIKSISVLKDAGSSAIYGSRAAFGVIIVKTKTGKGISGHKITYSNKYVYASPLNLQKMMNSVDFADYYNVAATNGGATPVFTPEVLKRIKAYATDPVNNPVTVANAAGDDWEQYANSNGNTDWFDVMYKDMVMRQQHNLSFAGNEKKLTYNISGSFFDAPGIISYGQDSYKRYTLNTNLSSKLTEKLSVNTNVRMSNIKTDKPSYDMDLYIHNIARRWPVNGIKMPNGSYHDGSEIPVLLDGGRFLSEETKANIGTTLAYEPIKDLKIKTSLYYRKEIDNFSKHYAKVFVIRPNDEEKALKPNNQFNRGSSESTYMSPNLVISYKKCFNGTHNFAGIAGFQKEKTEYSSINGSKKDLIVDGVPSISTATGTVDLNDSAGAYVTQGYFGQFTYNYKEKYLLQINGRYDASSRFAKDNRWDFFPSVSIGYNIVKEDFWKFNQVNLFKLRYSTGSIGNQNVSNYLYVSRMPIRTNLWWLGNTGRPNYTSPPNLISPNITWETVSTQNYGVDIGAFNNRLQSTFEYFVRTTDDMFGPSERYPSLLGVAAPKKNNASLETKGFEFSLNWKDNIGKVGYNIGIVLADAVTEVTKFRNPNNILSTYREGQKLGEIWGYETLGLYQNQSEIDKGPDQSKIYGGVWYPGDVSYADLNGDGVIDSGDNTSDNPGDRKIIGNSTPRYEYSINTGLRYKGIDISMFWQGVGQRDVWAGGAYTFGAYEGQWQSTAFIEHKDYWSEDNTEAHLPRPTFRGSRRNQQVQTRYLQDASYVRLKNLTVGFSFGKNVLESLNASKFRLYVSGENIFTVSNISKVYDPETIVGSWWGSGKMYPLQKSLAIGLNIQF